MVVLPAVALVAGPGQISWDQYPSTTEIKLANHSAFVLTVIVGGASFVLDPYTVDRYAVRDVRSLSYTATATVTPASSGTLLIQLADLAERIPGVYPIHLR